MESHQTVVVTETKETRISVEEVISQQDHLSEEQKRQLLGVTNKHKSVFDGKDCQALSQYLFLLLPAMQCRSFH
jgi:hypothetical protein